MYNIDAMHDDYMKAPYIYQDDGVDEVVCECDNCGAKILDGETYYSFELFNTNLCADCVEAAKTKAKQYL